MVAVGIVWIVIALGLWTHYKFMHRHDGFIPGGPPQRTFVGALMWPFYLGAFLVSKMGKLFGVRDAE